MFVRSPAGTLIRQHSLSVTADAAEIYKNKTFTVLINYSPGGPTDIEGRLFSRNIGRNIPGKPTVITKNISGSGGVVGATIWA